MNRGHSRRPGGGDELRPRGGALAAIEAEIARRAGAYRRDGWYFLPIAAILGSAVKPAGKPSGKP